MAKSLWAGLQRRRNRRCQTERRMERPTMHLILMTMTLLLMALMVMTHAHLTSVFSRLVSGFSKAVDAKCHTVPTLLQSEINMVMNV